MKVKIKHCRQLQYCMPGVKKFFLDHDLDWRGFVREGCEPQILLETGDVMAKRVVEQAIKSESEQ